MNERIYVMAEVGMAHDGSIGMAHAFIDALADCGVDAIKFQVHYPEESSIYELFRIPFSYADSTRTDYWGRTAFTLAQWVQLKLHCEGLCIDFVASPFSIKAAQMLGDLGVTKIKIGSGEVGNLLMISRICDFAKQIYLSSGMSNWQELDRTLSFINKYKTAVSVLQCSTAYPTNSAQWGLNVLTEMRNRYGIPVGFSDHSGEVYACLAAAGLGAKVIECHVTFDKRSFGPDSGSSLTIDQMKFLAQGIREIETALNNPVDKTDNISYQHLRKTFGKSLAVNKQLPTDHCIAVNDLETRKPAGHGIDPSDFENLIGKPLLRSLNSGDFLNYADLNL